MNDPFNRPNSSSAPRSIRFGPFTADLDSQELMRGETRLRVPGQSFRILVLLLAKPGALVTREQMQQELWPSDTFVDFDHGLSAAVKRLREALGDSADSPRYIETLPRRGYRFIGKIEGEKVGGRAAEESARPDVSQLPAVEESVLSTREDARPLWRWLLAGLVFAAVASLAALVFVAVRNRTAPQPTQRSAAVPFTSLPGIATAPAFSPDGSRIAFAWNGGNTNPNAPGFDLYVKALGGEEKLQLTHHPSDWISSAWSPDGTRIALHRMAGTDTGIYVVSSLGGPERKVIGTRIPYNVAAPITWSPDGKWIAFTNPLPSEQRDRIFRVSVETSEVIPFEHDPACHDEAAPAFSQDGLTIFYNCVHTMFEGDLRSRPVAGGVPKLVTVVPNPPLSLTVSGDGERVVFGYGYGWDVIAFVTLKDRSVTRVDVPENSEWPTISPQGDKLAFSTQLGSVSVRRRDLFHPETPPINVIPSSRQQNSPQYSPDGKRIAFESRRGGEWALWVSDQEGGNLLNVSKDILGSGGPRWSPDGTKIAFDTAAVNPSSVYVVDVSDAVPRKIQTQFSDMKLPAWSHDGKWIYFVSDSATGHRIYRCSHEGGIAEQLGTGLEATRPEESADGEYLYAASREVNLQLEKLALKDMKSGVQAEAIPLVFQWTLWHLTQNGIYFVPKEAPRTMRFFEFTTHKVKDVFTLDKDFADGISISSDGRYMLYSQVDEVNADIMVMDKYH